MSDFSELRKQFAVRDDLLWLNNCGVSLPPVACADEVKTYLDAYFTSGVLQSAKPFGEIKRNILGFFSKLLGGNPHEYAILANTAEGMTFVSQSLPLEAGEKILLVEREYPSNVYPFLQLKHHGIEIDFVSPGETNEEFVANIQKAISPRVRAMSLSAVDWITGRKFDLKTIGSLLKANNIWFLLDAAQGAGHVDIDVKTLGVDAMAFSCWKWLLGPLGSGGLFVSDDFMKKLSVHVAGTSSVKNDEVYLPHREDYKEGVDRFMLSTAPYMNWIHLEASLRFLDQVGFTNVQARLHELADKLSEILHRHGFTVLRDNFGAAKSAIVSCNRGDATVMQQMHAALGAAGVVCAYREGNLRFSPHLNFADPDLVRFEKIIASL
jgi:cysteine desulfurase / selenocysteine lyase